MTVTSRPSWALAATWLVGWAVEQGRQWSGLIAIALVAAAMIAIYHAVVPDLLGWALPFRPTGALTLQILVGALIVLAAIHGPALVRSSGILRRGDPGRTLSLWRERLALVARDLVQRMRERIAGEDRGQT